MHICDNAHKESTPARTTQCYCFYKSNAVTHHPQSSHNASPIGGALNIKNKIFARVQFTLSMTHVTIDDPVQCGGTYGKLHKHTNTLFTAAYMMVFDRIENIYALICISVMLQIYTRYIIMLCFLYNNILNVL